MSDPTTVMSGGTNLARHGRRSCLVGIASAVVLFVGGFGQVQAATPSIAVNATPNPAQFGAPVTLTASLTPSTATGKATFYNGVSMLGTASLAGGTATLQNVLLPAGTNSVTVRYSGDLNNSIGTSVPIGVQVNTVAAQGFGQVAINAPGTLYPGAMATGDFNGDGKPDVAMVDGGPPNLRFLLGNGDGTFNQVSSYPTSAIGGPYTLQPVDVNNDGKLDLVYIDGYTSAFFVLLGNGDGTFQPLATYPVAPGAPYEMTMADFNRDGKVDLVLVIPGYNPAVLLLPGNGDGSFGGPTTLYSSISSGAIAGDFNGDGNADLIVTTYSGLVGQVTGYVVMLGNGAGAFTSGSPIPFPFGTSQLASLGADLNNDGKLDLVFGYGTVVSVLPGNGDGTFGASITSPFGQQATALAVSDFNGDGKLDIFVTVGFPNYSNPASAIWVLLGDGTGALTPTTYRIDEYGGPALIGDFNSDHRVDYIGNVGNGFSFFPGLAPLDLAITKNHSGNFQQGQTNAAYTITVLVLAQPGRAKCYINVGIDIRKPACIQRSDCAVQIRADAGYRSDAGITRIC